MLALHEAFAPALTGTPMGGVLRERRDPAPPVLVDMEWAGVQIDLALFKRLSNELARDLEQLQVEIAQVAGENLNLNSPRQLAAVLFDRHQLPVLKKTKTGPSTDADVLEQLAEMGHDLPQLILGYRELQKLKSTYIDTLPSGSEPAHRPHPHQLQPDRCRDRAALLVRPEPAEHPGALPAGRGDPARLRARRGQPLRRGRLQPDRAAYHGAPVAAIRRSSRPSSRAATFTAQTAALIFNVPVEQVNSEQRGRAKTINFAIIYGQGPFALSKQLGITQEDAKRVHRAVLRAIRRRACLPRPPGRARQGAGIRGDTPRPPPLHPRGGERNFNLRSYGERNAQNSPLQGSAADLIKLAMIRIHTLLASRRAREPDAAAGA